MQALPIIISVLCSAAAIIAVLLWRIKPQPMVDVESLNRRIAAEANASAANATASAANTRANEAKKREEDARIDLENRLQELSQKHEALQNDYNIVAARASSAQSDAAHLRTQIDDMARTLESYEINLAEDRAKLNAALAKQQTNEDAVRQFETISQTILKDVMGEAKREVGELAATIQKASDEELSKHADKVARTLEPLQSRLEAYDKSIKSMEEASHKTFGGLTNQISELQKAEQSLHNQAKALTTALSASPKLRGNYGEIVLKRLVESVGMQERYHFEPQASRDTEEGRRIPDLIIFLPGSQKVIVDAKAIVNSCVQAYETQDEVERKLLLKKHSENVRSRVSDLSTKNYFANHVESVESVVLFLPTDSLYFAALENDPELTEFAASKRIIICSPGSLIMLLTVANHLWRQASIEKEAQDIKKCGEDIFNSACIFIEKYGSIGKRIQDLQKEYNGAVGSLETRLIPAGKKMSGFESVSRKRGMGEPPSVTGDVREFREATKQFVIQTPRLTDLTLDEFETAEMSFAAGDNP